MNIGAKLGQYFCANTHSKNSKDSMGGGLNLSPFLSPNLPLGYATALRGLPELQKAKQSS